MKSTLAHYHDGKFYLVTGQRSLSAGNNRPSEKGSKTVWIADDIRLEIDRRKKPGIRRNIGFMPLGSKNWIAGVNFLQNIIRAQKLLPDEEKSRLYMICRYDENISELVKGFDASYENIYYYAYFTSSSRRVKLKGIIGSLVRGRWPQDCNKLIAKLKIDAFAPLKDCPDHDLGVPWISWIPDFQHKHLPEFFPVDELEKRDRHFQGLIEKANQVMVTSLDGHKDLMRWFPTDENKVSICPYPFIPESSWYSKEPQKAIQKYRLPNKYLMFPSQFWAHKNHKMLFEVIRILVKEKGMQDVVLVCSGRQHDYRFPGHFSEINAFIQEHGLEGNIRLLGLIERDDQIQLIRFAAAIVQPSLFEGWCLMVEEARCFGKQIFLSDLPVHREQNPPNTHYFDPRNSQALADLIADKWHLLKPGVDIEAETQARERASLEEIKFAKRFNKIVEKTILDGVAR